jgi:hypothetical protein
MDNLVEYLKRHFGPHWPTQLFNPILALFFIGAILWLCWLFGATSKEVGINVLVCLLGALTGWSIGMFFSPFDKKDTARFQFLGKSVAAFASGYILSKLDSTMSAMLAKLNAGLDLDVWIRIALYGCSFLSSGIVTFVSRAYAHNEEVTKPEPRPLKEGVQCADP